MAVSNIAWTQAMLLFCKKVNFENLADQQPKKFAHTKTDNSFPMDDEDEIPQEKMYFLYYRYSNSIE